MVQLGSHQKHPGFTDVHSAHGLQIEKFHEGKRWPFWEGLHRTTWPPGMNWLPKKERPLAVFGFQFQDGSDISLRKNQHCHGKPQLLIMNLPWTWIADNTYRRLLTSPLTGLNHGITPMNMIWYDMYIYTYIYIYMYTHIHVWIISPWYSHCIPMSTPNPWRQAVPCQGPTARGVDSGQGNERHLEPMKHRDGMVVTGVSMYIFIYICIFMMRYVEIIRGELWQSIGV